MKMKTNKTILLLGLVILLGGVAGLFAQANKDADGDSDAAYLKQLLVKKFDLNGDGDLAPFEQVEAVKFLKDQDSNEDGEMSAAEKNKSIKQLELMKDPSKRGGTQKMTLENRNKSKRETKWFEFSKKLPHGAGPRIFTSKNTPGSPGFSVKGEKMVGVKEVPVKHVPLPVNNAELEKKREELKQKRDLVSKRPGAKVLPQASEKVLANKAKTAGKKSYYDSTVILAKDGEHTVLPVGAVLNLPPNLAKMIVATPSGKLIRWPDFHKKHARLFILREVSWDTIMGNDPISKEEEKDFKLGKKIVVAVYHKNPVGVLEARPKKEEGVSGAVASDSK